jgi:hypothetical protein
MLNTKHPTSFRLSEVALQLLKRLCQIMGINQTAVVEVAIRELAIKYGLITRKGKGNNGN